MTPDSSDRLLADYLGDNLMTATLRLIGAAAAVAAGLGLFFWIV